MSAKYAIHGASFALGKREVREVKEKKEGRREEEEEEEKGEEKEEEDGGAYQFRMSPLSKRTFWRNTES